MSCKMKTNNTSIKQDDNMVKKQPNVGTWESKEEEKGVI